MKKTKKTLTELALSKGQTKRNQLLLTKVRGGMLGWEIKR